MIYPTMVLIFATFVLVGMLMFLVPVFVKIFGQLGGELPTLTQWVEGVEPSPRQVVHHHPGDDRFRRRLPPLEVVGSRPQLWDRFKLRIPMKIGDVVLRDDGASRGRSRRSSLRASTSSRRSRSRKQTAGNWVVEEALADVRVRVHEGVPIAQPLIENPIFPPMVSQMVKIGEETGELEKMLGKIADFYEDEVDASIQSLTSIIEPLMMILVGLMVGVIIIAMYLPMFKMLTLLQ